MVRIPSETLSPSQIFGSFLPQAPSLNALEPKEKTLLTSTFTSFCYSTDYGNNTKHHCHLTVSAQKTYT